MFNLIPKTGLLNCLSHFYLAKRYFLRRRRQTREADRHLSSFYEQVWRDAATALGATVKLLGDGILEVNRGRARVHVCRNHSPLDKHTTLTIAGNKPLVYRLLAREGLPIPAYLEFSLASIGRAMEFVESIDGYSVVKPALDTGAGHGVTTGIQSTFTLAWAAAVATSYGDRLLIEQQIIGDSFRLLYLDGTLLDAVVRRPPTVVGDGKSTVHRLIERVNQTRLALAASEAHVLLTVDLDMRQTLAAQRLRLSSVPAEGTVVTLKNVINENGALENESATHLLCESIVADGARAAQVVGARLAGVDVITSDPTVPLAESCGVISEVNTTPGFYYHYHRCGESFPVAVHVLEAALGEQSDDSLFPSSHGSGHAWVPHETRGEAMRNDSETGPPVVMLGGDANALSVARSLGRGGIAVYGLGQSSSPVQYSRYCRWISLATRGSLQESWAAFLLGTESEFLRGAVLLAGCDDGIELIANRREELATNFKLDISNTDAQLRMLNKLATYRAAVAADIPTPRFWVVASRAQIVAIKDELRFPLLVKPLLSHVFAQRIGKGKFVRANTFDDVLAGFQTLNEKAGIEVMLVENIPGPDDRLCSYYTYLDDRGEPLFDFTKRVIRRSPMNRGPACYHETDWNPEVKDLALRLFRHVGLRGLANAEFKRDHRDGQLKLIECNARFTAANCLVAASGFDLARFVYNRLTDQPQEPLLEYEKGLRLWDPVLDSRAFLELRRQGQLSFGQWMSSLRHPKILPYFQWSDPLPSIMCSLERVRGSTQAATMFVRKRLQSRLSWDRSKRKPHNSSSERVGSGHAA